MSNELAKQDSVNFISAIERAASNPEIDIAKMQALLDMQERVLNRNAEMEFNQAMVDAQTEMRPVSADMDNKQTRSKYASYAKLDNAIRPIYTKHGFSLSFNVGETSQDMADVICYVSHIGGHTRTYHAPMPADGKGAKGGDVMTKTHAMGAAFSYGARYLLKMIFNVAVGEDDTDGNMPVERISEEQQANLTSLIEEIGANYHAFLKYMQAESLDRIRADQYDRAVSALEAKRKAS